MLTIGGHFYMCNLSTKWIMRNPMPEAKKKTVNVAVGIILRDTACFVTKRDQTVHQGGKWEFPGGKVEQAENVTQALTRELREEVGIELVNSTPFMLIKHDYGDKHVTLHIHTVTSFTGTPKGCEGQEGQWISINELRKLSFPDANKAIIEKLEIQHL